MKRVSSACADWLIAVCQSQSGVDYQLRQLVDIKLLNELKHFSV